MLFAVAVFAPLLGSLLAGLPGRVLGDRVAQAMAIGCMLVASACGVTAWVQHVWLGVPNGLVPVATWIAAGDFRLDWALQYGHLRGYSDSHLQRRLHGA